MGSGETGDMSQATKIVVGTVLGTGGLSLALIVVTVL